MLITKCSPIVPFLFFNLFLQISAVTHWVVTENGRIQSHSPSPFAIRRPYDLMALLDQEKRREDINTIYNDLLTRKDSIEKNWSLLEGPTGSGTKTPKLDPECLITAEKLVDIDLYSNIALNGTHRTNVTIDFESAKKLEKDFKSFKVPDCTKFSKLDFSMFTYEHFTSMRDRRNLTITPEQGLVKFLPVESLKLFGHEIVEGLLKNRSSWIHYNLASLYWRIKGNGSKAVECSRRALHFVPRQFRDIPLHNLAGILHVAHHSEEAAILLHAAIDHAPHEHSHYLALGNVYAALGDLNKSAQAYKSYIKLRPEDQDIHAMKLVLCQWKLERSLINLQESLEGVLSELHEYHSQQQQWMRLQERLMWEQSSFGNLQVKEYTADNSQSFLSNPTNTISKKSRNKCARSGVKSGGIMHCASLVEEDEVNINDLLQYVESESLKISEQLATGREIVNKLEQQVKTLLINDNNSNNFDDAGEKLVEKIDVFKHDKYPTSMPMSGNQYFDATGWPSKEECVSWNMPINENERLDLPVFLPPDNKGYNIQDILSGQIGLRKGTEHPLPWYPPTCENVFGEKYIPISGRQALSKQLPSSTYLENHFMKYVNDGKGQQAEIGQRIITAMEKKNAPTWVLATLASLYWRIRGNTVKALNCLDLAFQNLNQEPSDVVLVSIGSIIHQLGYFEHALKFASVALKINHAEPSTNFLLALLHYSAQNPVLAMYYLKNVLRAEPNYYDGTAETLLKTWACRIKLGGYESLRDGISTKNKKVKEEMCAGFDTEGVICSANGEQCKTANIQCQRTTKTKISEMKKIEIDSVETVKLEKFMMDSKLRDKVDLPTCGQGLGRKYKRRSSLMALRAAEKSKDFPVAVETEPDQSQLETFNDNGMQALYMRISLNLEDTASEGGLHSLGDFYVSVPIGEPESSVDAMLHVYDKTGTYPLSPKSCREIKDADWLRFTSMWQSFAARHLYIAEYLKPIPTQTAEEIKPKCTRDVTTSDSILDHLTFTVLLHTLPDSPETGLYEWLGLIAGDQEATLKELGSKIGIALQENTTSWILATAAALYWRIIGNTEEAITCLRHALLYVPAEMRDIPLMSLANVLHRIGFFMDALEVSYLAIKSHPEYAVNHFTVGNIYSSMGDLEKGIHFYRAALSLDPNFEPARNRLQSLLCTLLFDEEVQEGIEWEGNAHDKFSSL